MAITPNQIAELSPLLEEVHDLLLRLIDALPEGYCDRATVRVLEGHAANLHAWRLILEDDWDYKTQAMIDHMAALWGPDAAGYREDFGDGAEEVAYRERLAKNADTLFAKFDQALKFF